MKLKFGLFLIGAYLLITGSASIFEMVWFYRQLLR
jgi:hypothetical protein